MTVPRKVFVKTYGCQMNEYDSDKMVDVLREAHGLQRTETPDDADVILFNTCSVREKAQEKVFSELGRVRELKLLKPHLVIGVGGCVASQEGASIVSRAPYVDVVFGPQTLHRLPALIDQRRRSGVSQVDISFPEIEKFDHLPTPRVDAATAFVSIMEGCSKYCSFCVVPFTRGEEVSRGFEDVLVEIAALAEQGVREVTLLGQNVNAYSAALPEGLDAQDGERADFARLLEYVAAIPGIDRIRYTTSHPKEFTPRLIDAYRQIDCLADQVHLPVQSGSDRILSAMKRGYTTLEFRSIVRRLRAARPSISISTDFIVGFPGESEEDFAKTLALADDVGFDGSFSFVYSARPGTPAADLTDDTPQSVKLERLQRLLAITDGHAARIGASMVDSRQRLLIDRRARKNASEWSGRTSNNRVVNFVVPAAFDSDALIGTFAEVEISSAMSHSLRGEWIAACD